MFSADLIISLLLILAVAWSLGYLFSRLNLPLMLGELLAGLILGPPLLGLVAPTPALNLMAELGIFFAMFYAGVESDPREFVEHLWPSVATAIGGLVLPIILGYGVARLFGGTVFQSLFVALGISVTAVAVQAVILKEMRIKHSPIGHVIIGAAVFNDVVALMILSVLLGVAETGTISFKSLLWLLVKDVGFFCVVIGFGEFIMPRLTRRLTDEQGKGFTFAMVVSLAMAYFAELAGLHLVIGAFLAGQFVRREIMDEKVFEVIADRFYGISYGFLVPIFFATLSFHLTVTWTWAFWGFSLVLIVAAIIGKVIGAGGAAKLFGYNFRESAVVGIGMNSRGAVELVIATVVLETSARLQAAGTISEPLLTNAQFSVLVLTAFATTLLTPLALKPAVASACTPDEHAHFCTIMDNAPRK